MAVVESDLIYAAEDDAVVCPPCFDANPLRWPGAEEFEFGNDNLGSQPYVCDGCGRTIAPVDHRGDVG